MTLFPNKSPFEILDGHEFGWDTIQPTHTPFIAVPVCGYCVSVSGESHLLETESGLSFFRFELVCCASVCILSHLHGECPAGRSFEEMSIKYAINEWSELTSL